MPNRGSLSSKEINTIKVLYNQGMEVKDIVKKTGFSNTTIYRHLDIYKTKDRYDLMEYIANQQTQLAWFRRIKESFKVGDQVFLKLTHLRKDNLHLGKVIYKNQHFITIQFKNYKESYSWNTLFASCEGIGLKKCI